MKTSTFELNFKVNHLNLNVFDKLVDDNNSIIHESKPFINL